MPPGTFEKPFIRNDVAAISGMDNAALKTAIRREQVPFVPIAGDEAMDAVGWARYSPFDALLMVAARQLHIGNSSFASMGFAEASHIIANASGLIMDRLPRILDQESGVEIFAGYAWFGDGGMGAAGSLPEILDQISHEFIREDGKTLKRPRLDEVRSLALVNLSYSARLVIERARAIGYDIAPDFSGATKVEKS